MYEVGDKVIVKSFDEICKSGRIFKEDNIVVLNEGKENHLTFVPEMKEYCDCKATIVKVFPPHDFYSLDIDNGRWTWCDSMLVPFTRNLYLFDME